MNFLSMQLVDPKPHILLPIAGFQTKSIFRHGVLLPNSGHAKCHSVLQCQDRPRLYDCSPQQRHKEKQRGIFDQQVGSLMNIGKDGCVLSHDFH